VPVIEQVGRVQNPAPRAVSPQQIEVGSHAVLWVENGLRAGWHWRQATHFAAGSSRARPSARYQQLDADRRCVQ
jgi:hypothetical protein